LRRTCAQLCHRAGGELEQIQFLLGHASVQTTECHLGCKQRLSQAVNSGWKAPDKVGWPTRGLLAGVNEPFFRCTTSDFARYPPSGNCLTTILGDGAPLAAEREGSGIRYPHCVKCCQLRTRFCGVAIRRPTGRVARIRFPSVSIDSSSTSCGMLISTLGAENSGLFPSTRTSTV